MAKKEKGNAVGYLVLSVIPVMGIIWAIVAGIAHSGYVKDANNAEKEFEANLKTKINELHNSEESAFSGFPEIAEDLNITCLLPIAHDSLLLGDDINSERSYTLEIGANPVLVENVTPKTLDHFEFKYEFFITLEVYQDICENYLQEKLVIEGIEDNTFETYYKNNPRNAPVYKVVKYFEQYYKHVVTYEYKGEIIKGTGPSQVIDLIDNLGEITADSDFELDRIENIYKLLTDEEKTQVTNYDMFIDARSTCDALMLNKKINDKLVEINGEYKYSQYSVLEGFVKDYSNIDTAHQSYVSSYNDLVFALKNVYGKSVENFVDKFKDKALDALETSDYTAIKNAAKYYNSLATYCETLDELKNYLQDGYYDTLITYVDKYNEDKSTKIDLATYE